MPHAVCRNARRWSQRFERGGAGRVDIDARGSCVPAIGKLVAVEWDERTRKVRSVTYERHVHGRGTELRKHEFREDAAPLVSRTRAGKLRLTGGSYKVSSQRGITDMAKKKGKKGRAKKNIFRKASPDRTMKFVEATAITGGTAVAVSMLGRVLLDRYTSWEPSTKTWVRGVVPVLLGVALYPDTPRVAAGIATAGAVVLGEKVIDALGVERQLIEVLPTREQLTPGGSTTTTTGGGTTTTTTTGGGTTTTTGGRGLGPGGRPRLVQQGGREYVTTR